MGSYTQTLIDIPLTLTNRTFSGDIIGSDSMDRSPHRPKLKSMDRSEVLATVTETPDHIRAPWPTWLEDLLSVVWHDNLQNDLTFFCVSCREGLFEVQKDFEKPAYHYGHRRLRTYVYERSVCVNSVDIEVLGVGTEEIQQFRWSAPQTASSLFVFLHNTFESAGDSFSMAASWKNCAHCRRWLQSVRDWTQTRFCCLDCRFQFMNSNLLVSQQESLLPRLISTPRVPPSFDLHLADLNSAPVTTQGTSYKKSLRHVLTIQQQSGWSQHSNSVFPEEEKHRHMASQSAHHSEMKPREIEGDYGSSVFDTVDAEELKQCDDLDIDAVLDEFQLLSMSPRGESEPRRMSELYSFLPDSVYPSLPHSEDEMTPIDRSDSGLEVVQRSSEAHTRKCKPVHPLQVIVPETPTNVFGKMVPTDRPTSLTADSKCDRITHVELQGHSKSTGDGHYTGYDRAPEQYFGTGSESWDKLGAVSHSAGHASVEHIRERRDVDGIELLDVLYEDQQEGFLSPREDLFRSLHITTPHGPPANSPEDRLSSSADNCKQVKNLDRQKLIPIQPECMLPTSSAFRAALAAASSSSNADVQWWHHKVFADTKSDWDVEGEGKEVEGLGFMSNSLDDNILRKAASLLRSFGSDCEDIQRTGEDDDAISIQSSSPSGETGQRELVTASPEVVSVKIDASVDVTLLKQLMSTFDPKSWISNARCPEQVPSKASIWSAPVL